MKTLRTRISAVAIPVALALVLAACAGAPERRPGISPATGTPEGVTLPDYEVTTLPNGMELVLVEKRDVPLVAFNARISGGALADAGGKEGTAHLLAELLTKGAGRRDAAEFAEAVAAVGGNFSVSAGIEAIELRGEFMAGDTGLMLDLLHDVLREPLLDEQEFARLRERSIQQIAAAKDTSLRSLVNVYGDAFIYGDHPYGRPSGGSEASLANVDYTDLREYHREHVGADRMTLTVVGDIDAAAVKRMVEDRLADWRNAAAEMPQPPDTSTRVGGKLLLIDKPGATQTYFAIGNTGVSRRFDRRAAVDLVNTVFGGRFTSMLNTELRVEAGLTYGAYSRVEQLGEGGAISMVSFTATETTTEAIDLALETLDRLHAGGLSGEMLASARTYVLGQMPPDFETSPELAAAISEIEQLDLGADYVNAYDDAVAAVELAATNDVIRDVYPTRDELLFVLIGDADRIRDEVSKYGEITEMKISEPHFSPHQ